MHEIRLIKSFESEFFNGKKDRRHNYDSNVSSNARPNVILLDGIEVGCAALNWYGGMDWVQLSYIFIYQPQNGVGSKVLSRLCEMADECGVNIMLDAVPQKPNSDSISPGKLISWYQQFGFTRSPVEGSRYMERMCNVKI